MALPIRRLTHSENRKKSELTGEGKQEFWAQDGSNREKIKTISREDHKGISNTGELEYHFHSPSIKIIINLYLHLHTLDGILLDSRNCLQLFIAIPNK